MKFYGGEFIIFMIFFFKKAFSDTKNVLNFIYLPHFYNLKITQEEDDSLKLIY